MHKISARLEAILFSTHDFVSLKQLATITGLSDEVITQHLDNLKRCLAGTGLRLVEHNKTYQLVASTDYATDIQAIQKEKPPVLSSAALEVLAIIAYHQPVTKSQIEQIRGVASDQSIKNLLARHLISEQHNQAKTKTSYQTTGKFLQQLGLTDIKQLPKFDVPKEIYQAK